MNSNEWTKYLLDNNVLQTTTIYALASKGIRCFRYPNWVDPNDHIEMDVIEGLPGPWFRMYSEHNKETNGRNPVVLSFVELNLSSDQLVAFDPSTQAAQKSRESDEVNT